MEGWVFVHDGNSMSLLDENLELQKKALDEVADLSHLDPGKYNQITALMGELKMKNRKHRGLPKPSKDLRRKQKFGIGYE